MEHESEVPIGRRIQALRKERGIDQKTLAMKLDRSPSWMTKIERGERQIDSVTMLLRVAEVLNVELHNLTRRPSLESGGRTLEGSAGLKRLRKAVMRPDAFASYSVELSSPPRPVARMREDARRLRQQYNTSPENFSAVVPLLPVLLNEVQSAVAVLEGEDRSDAQAVLANLYRLANLELRQYGDVDLAWIAGDKSLAAAERSGRPVLLAACAATMTVQMMIQGHAAEAVDFAQAAAASLAGEVADERGSAIAVTGALHLYSAQAAARAEDPAEAARFLKRAGELAEALRTDREDHWLFFGSTNLGIQEVGILVDLDDPTAALRRAQHVDPNRLPSVNRRGYFHLHRARAFAMKRQDREAVQALTAAEQAAPELTRWDPMTRESIRAMLEREKRTLNPELRALASRLLPDL